MILVPTNPDLVDILGDTDVGFDVVFVFFDSKFLDF